MDIHITLHANSDLVGQIYRQIRAGILDGRLQSGERLPSSRYLAVQLGVSRKTTLEAFERLASEGFLFARPGSGTYVADAMTRLPTIAARPSGAKARAGSLWDTLPTPISMPRPTAALPMNFAGGVTDKTVFPVSAWRRCVNHALRDQLRDAGGYREPAGEPQLRLAVSRYLGFNRALHCTWQDVIVTQGAQQALDLIARVMIRPGDTVAIEDPCYPPARASFTALGAKIAPTPVETTKG